MTGDEGAHLTSDGLAKIVSIKASMIQQGLSDKLAASFPTVVPEIQTCI
jgi:hypothetical protein